MAVPDPDPRRLQQAIRGDGEGFRHLVDLYAGPVQAIAQRYLGSSEEARDALQEVFLRLAERIDRYDPGRPFVPWFLRLATNVVINLHHRRAVRTRGQLRIARGDDPVHARDGTPEEDGPPARAAARELRERLLAGIGTLPEAYRRILTMRYVDHLSYDEIGRALALPSGTVKNRLHRARAALRRQLAPLLEGPDR
jgi:RNA polymerase sigma-70 factor (ECF subfamily)